MSAEDEQVDKPKRRQFGRRDPALLLPPESAKRQSLITHLAFLLLGGREEAIAFLNTHNETLGGRPLDRATADSEGYAAVEEAIRSMARAPDGPKP